MELEELKTQLSVIVAESKEPDVMGVLKRLRSASDTVGRAWSKSWIGYHARTYYDDFEVPPPSAYFSVEWGLQRGGTVASRGTWIEYSMDDVRVRINDLADNPDRGPLLAHEAVAKAIFVSAQATLKSILVTAKQIHDDDVIREALDEVRSMTIRETKEIVKEITPSTVNSRDRRAVDEGIQCPPHLLTLAILTTIESADWLCRDLLRISVNVAQHIRRAMSGERETTTGRRVFIGHGRSLQWRVLKDFLQDTLGLEWEEFNRIPVAGRSTKERLEQMLDSSSMALLICTAEDEREPGEFHARENVIHEVGLFQGRLSFEKAIVMLEEGCTEFSNIDGLTVIKFPREHIGASFEEVRQVLIREGVVT